MTTALKTTAQCLHALAHPARLRVLAMLRHGELCVCQITAALDLAPSTVSAHLAALRQARMVEEDKKGRWVYYRLGADPWVTELLNSVWEAVAGDPQVEADERLLTELRSVDPEELCRVGKNLQQLGIGKGIA